MKNDISQSLGLDLDNINIYAEVYKYIPLSPRDKAIFTFSEFGASQSLDRWKISFCNSLTFFRIWTSDKNSANLKCHFDNLIGYIFSISMCMQNFITIFHSVQGIAPLSLFQNLELGKASTNEKCHFAISWARSCQCQCLRNSLSKYSTQFKR